MTYRPKRIIRIVSTSRSGSTYLYHMLAQSPRIDTLMGELEAIWSWCGHRLNATNPHGDVFDRLVDPLKVARVIDEEVHRTKTAVVNRLLMQHGPLFDVGLAACSTKEEFVEVATQLGVAPAYDRVGAKGQFVGNVIHEMPPYVIPIASDTHLEPTGILLVKNPADSLRGELLGQVYPGVPITNIILHRRPEATVCGLYSGWNYKGGFHKCKLPNGHWWKFEAPNGWHSMWDHPIIDRCVFQWYQSLKSINNCYPAPSMVIDFDELLQDPQAVLDPVLDQLGVPPVTFTRVSPKMSSTCVVNPNRWKDSEQDYTARVKPFIHEWNNRCL